MSVMSPPPSTEFQQPESKGLAIASVSCSALGICVPLLSLVGIVLGAIAMSKMRNKGLALTGVILGVAAVLINIVLLAGILLPALGKARQSAQQIKSSTQVRALAQGVILYQMNMPDGVVPSAQNWEQELIGNGYITKELLVAPGANDPVKTSYIYVPGWTMKRQEEAKIDPAQQVIFYEDATLFRRRGINIAYLDGRVEFVPIEEARAILQATRDGFGNPVPVPP